MCMAMELMVLTNQTACYGLAEGLVATFGLWILGPADRQELTSWHQLSWSISLMHLP